jgi:hypothetical protein
VIRRLLAAMACTPFVAYADPAADAQRAVLERDRQSAEFAHPQLRDFHARRDQLHLPARADERAAEARDRDAYPVQPPAPATTAPDYRPLPLPGGPRHGVDPIPVQGAGG